MISWLTRPRATRAFAIRSRPIVSAWYLGYTGTPISLRAEDDTGFVTFTKALMYEPTMDATVRPTYARAGINYWVEPPDFVTPPPAPPGIKSWGRESPQGIGAIPEAAAPRRRRNAAAFPAAGDGAVTSWRRSSTPT